MTANVLVNVLALLQDAAPEGNASMVRIISGAIAAVLIGLVIMRRKRASKKEEDEF